MAAKGMCFIASWVCRQKYLTEMAVYILVILVRIRHKILKPVSDVLKWVKTLEMKSLPICCECLTVTDLDVYPHEDPFTLENSVKWLQGKWIRAREGINSLLEMLFMLFPILTSLISPISSF